MGWGFLGYLESVKLLLNDSRLKPKENNQLANCFSWACFTKNESMIKYLLTGKFYNNLTIDDFLSGEDFFTGLIKCFEANDSPIIDLIINHPSFELNEQY